MQFQVDAASRTPIYRQLVEQVREALARGEVAPGDPLPSVRELSRRVVLNPNTVARAYAELEREGLLHTRQGLGVFVARSASELTRAARRKRLGKLIDQLLVEAVHLEFSAEEVISAVSQRASSFQWGQETGRKGVSS